MTDVVRGEKKLKMFKSKIKVHALHEFVGSDLNGGNNGGSCKTAYSMACAFSSI